LKNSNGFSLIEVMTALTVFTVVAAAALPMLIHVYKERSAIAEERQALEILQNRVQLWLATGNVPDDNQTETIRRSGTTYHFTSERDQRSGIITACINWTGSNERGYRKCRLL
jgi:prepilin-type N-terminal cleavage/methylation domain-containing protein